MSEGRASSYGTYQAKRTFYNGVWFKSNLEARVAEALDDLGVRWEYETRCFRDHRYEGGQYTPDFWLPECFTYLEVAGVIDERHMNNALVFCETQNVVNDDASSVLPPLKEESPMFLFVDGKGRPHNPLGMNQGVWIMGCLRTRKHISFRDVEKHDTACHVCGEPSGVLSTYGPTLFSAVNTRARWIDEGVSWWRDIPMG